MSDISIINLSAYTSPIIQENKKDNFIEYGADNNYFQYLIDRFLYSATNGAIITGVANMIYGKGLDALDSNKKPNEYAQMKSIVKDSDLKKIALERKLLGMAAIQVVKEKNQVKKILHFPMHTLRAGKCNDKGEIETWYYHYDWKNKKPSEEIKPIPAFGFGNGNEVEIYVLKPYISGFDYYAPIDYSGSLPYALLEENIADYQINDCKNGFSGTKIINFNNGIPSEEQRETTKRDVLNKLTGAKGEKVIIAFNNNAESKTTVEDLPLNDAPAHYEYLSKECFEKLIVGHRVTNPMLLGIKETGSGLSNNADEIETSMLMFLNLVIKPYQEEILNALDTILAVNNISLDLRFKRLQPLDNEQIISSKNPIIEAVNSLSPLVANKVLESMTANEIRALIGLAAEQGGEVLNPSVAAFSKQLKSIDLDDFLNSKGEVLDDNWVCVDETEVDYDSEKELDLEINELNKKSTLFKIINFANAVGSRPNSKSEQDEEIKGNKFITRYAYTGNENPEREFCKKMMSASKNGRVYRKEDLENVNSKSVNDGFENDNTPYNIFLYKGGPRCQHKFLRKTFVNMEGVKIDVNNPNAKTISVAKAEKLGYRIRNKKEVAMIPNDMPLKGFHPNNKNLPKDV